ATIVSLLTIVPCVLCSSCHHPPTTDTYTLSLHDALPIFTGSLCRVSLPNFTFSTTPCGSYAQPSHAANSSMMSMLVSLLMRSSRSEEHTSELQSRENLVCRLLLEKKKMSDIR